MKPSRRRSNRARFRRKFKRSPPELKTYDLQIDLCKDIRESEASKQFLLDLDEHFRM